MPVKIGGVDGSDKHGTSATGGGDGYPAGDLQADTTVEINKRVPPGVLIDEKLQSLGHAHGQTECKNATSITGANFGGIESIDQDGGSAFGEDEKGDESNVHSHAKR